MKRNINTIQNISDANLANVTEKYLIEALANLGQRYSIKGDGISIRVNAIGEIIPEFSGYDPAEYIVKVDKSEDETAVVFTLVDNDLNPVTNGDDIVSFVEEIQPGIFDPQYSFILNETNVDRLDTLYIYSNDNYFIYSGEEISGNDSRFICEKYEKYTNTLSSSIKVIPYTFKNGYNFVVLYLYKHSNELYYLNIYHLNVVGDEAEDFVHYVAMMANEEGKEPYSFTPESYLSELYAKYKENSSWSWENHYTTVQTTMGDHNIIVYHVIYDSNSGSYTIDKVLDDYKEDELQPEEEFITTTLVDPILYDTVYGLDKYVQYQQYNQTYLYPKLKTKYSDEIFKSNNTSSDTSYKTLFRHILKTLFLYSYNGQPLYIPLDYEFEYAYNTNNKWQIYYSAKDICIHDVSIISENVNVTFEDIKNTILQYKDKSGLVRIVDSSTGNVEKSTFYNFYVEPDPTNTTDIYSINVTKHFTMPYISETGYWVVDDIETSIYAKGKDAGNPNITIVNSDPYDHDVPEILTGGDINYLNSLEWKTTTAKIEFPKHIIRNGNDVIYEQITVTDQNISTFECSFFVPDLSKVSPKKLEEHIDKLKYCILLNMSSVKSIEDYDPTGEDEFSTTIRQVYGEDGIIMTFWTLVYENGEYLFKDIRREDDIAVDINYMTNLYNAIGYAIMNYRPDDPDNFMFTQLVFDNVNYMTKNHGVNSDANFPAYPVIKTLSAITNTQNHHYNNFNLRIEYNDTVEGLNYYNDDFNKTLADGSPETNDAENKSYTYLINSIYQSQDRRWFDNWAKTASESSISNEDYTYNQETINPITGVSEVVSSAYLEYLPNSMTYSVPMLDLSEIFVKDHTSLNKVNIVSFDQYANSYYSYIGTSHDTNDKSYLTIGTSKQNINIGTDTLVDSHKEMFNRQTELHIEFDNTRITSYSYFQNDIVAQRDIITYGTNWRRFDIDSTTYWTTTFRQAGKFDPSYIKLSPIDGDEYSNAYKLYNTHNAFIAATVLEQYNTTATEYGLPFNLYINDMVSVPQLIRTLNPSLEDALSSYSIIVESDNTVAYCNAEQLGKIAYVGVQMNSSMQKDIYIQTENTLAINVNASKVFISNELEISYYKNNDIYYFTINDMTNTDNMAYVHKLRQYYLNGDEPISIPAPQINTEHDYLTPDSLITLSHPISGVNITYSLLFMSSSDEYETPVYEYTGPFSIDNENIDFVTYTSCVLYAQASVVGIESETISKEFDIYNAFSINLYKNIEEAGTVESSGTILIDDKYAYNTPCTITASAAQNYSFLYWKHNDETIFPSQYGFTVTESADYIAYFEGIPIAIEVAVNYPERGYVVGWDNNPKTFHYGDECTLVAEPYEGCIFSNWTKDGNILSANSSYSFIVRESETITANFDIDPQLGFIVTVTQNSTEFGNIIGANSYMGGETCTLYAIPNNGYEFINWQDENNNIIENNSYSFIVDDNTNVVTTINNVTHQYVNLGLPSGTLWAINDVCDEIGNPLFFAWGDTQGYTSDQIGVDTMFNGEDYVYGPFDEDDEYNYGMTKYNHDDGKTVLNMTDDAAAMSWGSEWELPSKENFEELIQQTTVSLDTNRHGLVFSKNGQELFLRANGIGIDGQFFGEEIGSLYMTKDLDSEDIQASFTLDFSIDEIEHTYSIDIDALGRFGGISVRPIFKQKANIIVTANDELMGTVSGSGEYTYGSIAEISAHANEGYKFDGWYIYDDLVSTGITYSFKVIENIMFEAHFSPAECLSFTSVGTSTIALNKVILASGNLDSSTMEYSLDMGDTWNEYHWTGNSGETITLQDNEMVFMRGSLASSNDFSIFHRFNMTGQLYANGDITSLVNGIGGDCPLNIYQFNNLFNGCSALKQAPCLPSTTLAQGCYNNMFGHSGLIYPPILSATTLANSCYFGMFNSCSALIEAPELPAKALTDNCYSTMFAKCTSLVTAPNLPAIKIMSGCYEGMFTNCTSLVNVQQQLPSLKAPNTCYESMFSGCTALMTAPNLLAMYLEDVCYDYMFYGCTSLVNAPELPAYNLAEECYYNMFCGCTSLVNAPELLAHILVQDCYKEMFKNCANLNYIKATFYTTPSNDYTEDWVSGVANSGTFVKNYYAEWNVTGNNGIPIGWTVQLNQPE